MSAAKTAANRRREAERRSDAELARYDDHHNEYLVTRLLRQSHATGTLLGSTQ